MTRYKVSFDIVIHISCSNDFEIEASVEPDDDEFEVAETVIDYSFYGQETNIEIPAHYETEIDANNEDELNDTIEEITNRIIKAYKNGKENITYAGYSISSCYIDSVDVSYSVEEVHENE